MIDQITSHVWFTCTPVYKKRSPEDIAHSNELADSVRTEAIAIPSSFKIYQITFVRLLQSRSNYITPKFDKAVIFLSYLLEIRNCLKRYSLLCLVNLSNFLNRHLTVRPAHTLLLTGLMGRHYESENRSTPSLITHTSSPWRHDACSIDGPIRKVSVDREQLPYLPHDAHSNQRYDGNISWSGLCMGCSFKTPPVLCRLWMNRFVSNTHLHVVCCLDDMISNT